MLTCNTGQFQHLTFLLSDGGQRRRNQKRSVSHLCVRISFGANTKQSMILGVKKVLLADLTQSLSGKAASDRETVLGLENNPYQQVERSNFSVILTCLDNVEEVCSS